MMKKSIQLVLVLMTSASLAACASRAEIAAQQQLDTACLAGDLQACAAVQQRVTAENQALATAFPARY